MKRNVLLLPLLIFLLIAAALLWQLARNAQGDDPTNLESALTGKPVPAFRLESLETPGQYYEAEVLTQGKPVLLNVWATWCPTCRAEHQYLNRLAAQGIRVVGLNYKDDRAKAVAWLKELGNPYALSLSDSDGCWGWARACTARRKPSHRRQRDYPLPPCGRFECPGMGK